MIVYYTVHVFLPGNVKVNSKSIRHKRETWNSASYYLYKSLHDEWWVNLLKYENILVTALSRVFIVILELWGQDRCLTKTSWRTEYDNVYVQLLHSWRLQQWRRHFWWDLIVHIVITDKVKRLNSIHFRIVQNRLF